MYKRQEVIFTINSKEVARVNKENFRQPFSGGVGFRPWRNTIKLYEFKVDGNWNTYPDVPYVFQKDELGYHCFRNPSIVKTKNNTLLAFAQARKKDCHDLGDRDIMVKRSTDGGKTWGAAIMIFDDGKNTCTGPVPIVDEKTGRISLIMTQVEIDYEAENELGMSELSRDVFISYSSDDALTWTVPHNITKQTFDSDWDIIATGPGAGVQLNSKRFNGRMIVPCYHRNRTDKVFYSPAMYSDDGGDSWKIGERTPFGKTTECKITTLKNDQLFMSMRQENPKVKRREVCISKDGGLTWEDQRTDSTLIDSGCQGSLAYYQNETQTILFSSGPYSEIHREKMTISSSFDDGKTWTNRYELNNNPAAYSDLILLKKQELACFYEHGFMWPYEGLLFENLFFDNSQDKEIFENKKTQ